MTLAIIGGTCMTPWREILDSLVLCEEGRITWVGPRAQNEPPPGAQHLDAAGVPVLPGLIDTPLHGSPGDDVIQDGGEGIQRGPAAAPPPGPSARLAGAGP